MNKTNLLLTVSVILLLLCVVMIVVYWDVLFVPYTPSISQIHKQNCAYLNDVLDEIGVPEDSPYRKNCVGELNACPKTLRPTKGPDGKWVCPGDSKLTTSRNGDPCCMVPPPLEDPSKDSAGKKVEDFVKDNKINKHKGADEWTSITIQMVNSSKNDKGMFNVWLDGNEKPVVEYKGFTATKNRINCFLAAGIYVNGAQSAKDSTSQDATVWADAIAVAKTKKKLDS